MTRIVQFWSFAPIIDQPLLASLPDFISEKDRNDVTRLMYYDLKRFLDE